MTLAMRCQRIGLLLLAVLALAIALGGCGDEEEAFDADSFVAAANARGAGLTLGESLPSTREEFDVRNVELATPAGGADRAQPEGARGTLVVTASDEQALAEYRRCEESVDLLCFRAANVALYFGEADPAALAPVSAAIAAMGEG